MEALDSSVSTVHRMRQRFVEFGLEVARYRKAPTGRQYRKLDCRRLLDLLPAHLSAVTVWASGSRVKGESDEAGDLDLVLHGPGLAPIPHDALDGFVEALRNSNIPMVIEARDWARLPESFHPGIAMRCVVLREGDVLPAGATNQYS